MRDHPPTTLPMTLLLTTAMVHQHASLSSAGPNSWKLKFTTMAFRRVLGLMMLPRVNSSQPISNLQGDAGEGGDRDKAVVKKVLRDSRLSQGARDQQAWVGYLPHMLASILEWQGARFRILWKRSRARSSSEFRPMESSSPVNRLMIVLKASSDVPFKCRMSYNLLRVSASRDVFVSVVRDFFIDGPADIAMQ